MQTSEIVEAPTTDSAPRWAFADWLPRWLSGWRGLTILGLAVVSGGLALGWGWLTAIGLAPIILSLAPCAVMCAIGACAMSRGGSSCDKPTAQTIEPPAPSTTDR